MLYIMGQYSRSIDRLVVVRRTNEMPYPDHTPQEVETRGETIYEQRIRAEVEPEHKGEFLVIDIETGEYEVDQSDLAATKRALVRRPDAVLYGLRIGYPTAYRLGGRFATEPQIS